VLLLATMMMVMGFWRRKMGGWLMEKMLKNGQK
jgi:hypothetical protein